MSPNADECTTLSARVASNAGKKDSNSTIDKQVNALQLYPNPATSIVNVAAHKSIEQVDIVSIDGRRIQSMKIIGTRAVVSVAALQKGTYLLIIKYKDGTWGNKLIIKQ